MKKINEAGFTFIEMMISMVISSLVIAGVYGVYRIQQRSYTVQDQVAEMQQRLRFAMDAMVRDIRMAGHNKDNCSGSKILLADKEEFEFEYCKDGNSPEISHYVFDDSDGDGINDYLGRLQGGQSSPLPIAEGVDGLEFLYFDEDGNQTVTLKDIRSIQVSILIRSTFPDEKYTDKTLYTPGSENTSWINPNPPNDNFHRRLLISTIKLRNML